MNKREGFSQLPECGDAPPMPKCKPPRPSNEGGYLIQNTKEGREMVLFLWKDGCPITDGTLEHYGIDKEKKCLNAIR